MTSNKDTASFFENGTTEQFEYCFKLYPEALRLKAEKRCKKPQELIRLDQWYQNELPKLIKGRGKDAHMIYDELVQTMKWKQSRGKFYPQLSYLVKVNTPRAVMQETKKAFRKLPNLEQAITALSNLKGVGTTMASALLAAAAPHSAPFMADECLMAIPEIEGIDYTTKEYLNFVQHIQSTVQRLNAEAGGGGGGGGAVEPTWSPHRVELALWAHYIANDLSPDLLDDMPTASGAKGSASIGNGNSVKTLESVTGDSLDTDSADKVLVAGGEDTNDGEDTNESLVVARGGETNNTATESETDNENTNPIPTILVNNVAPSGDGDSNFISNDSTSQEGGNANNIMDEENTTQTTATTSTDDGEVGTNTPLASDSESNMEIPAKANNNNIAPTTTTPSTTTPSTTDIVVNNVNEAATTTEKEKEAETVTATATEALNENNILKSDIVVNNGSSKITEVSSKSKELVGNGNGNGNGNGSLLAGGVATDSLDGENSSCLRSRSSANEEASEDYDEDDESMNSNSVGGACVTLTNKSVTAAASKDDDSKTATTTTPTVAGADNGGAQKRSMLQCGGDEKEPEPDLKKIRSD